MAHARAYLNRIGCAVPRLDVHRHFIDWASERIEEPRERAAFGRMAEQSGIEHRWSVLGRGGGDGSPTRKGGFYGAAEPPPTSERMKAYEHAAPLLALDAIGNLPPEASLETITHLVVASCTGFTAPGIDQIVAERLGLPSVERTLIGYMGCYAAVVALRTARHIVRSEPEARVLVVTIELSSIHLQDTDCLPPLLAMLQFGDGAAAALVSAEESGFLLTRQFAVTIPASADLIGWTIGDTGFSMHLSGEVPTRIAAALREPRVRAAILSDLEPELVDCWAVHAGGRSILNAVERGLGLAPQALAASRSVLSRFGNMSSSTLMFVLGEQLAGRSACRSGVALAFGPGLAAEGFHFKRAG